MPTFSQSQKGFSLGEVMIAMGVSVLVMLSFGAAFKMVAQSSTAASQAVGTWTTVAVVGTNFSSLAGNAKPSAAFIHLPVNSVCTGTTDACLRTSDGTKYVDAPSGSVTQSTIEFYTDADGAMKNTFKVIKRLTQTDTTYTASDIISVQRSPSSVNQLQATWPLIDSTSQPFPMFVSAAPAQYLIPSFTASSSATPGSWMFMKFGTGSPFTRTAMLNQLVSVFSADNPHINTIQVVTAAEDCGTYLSDCQAAVDSAFWPTILPSDMVVKVAPIDGSHDASNLQSYLPAGCTPGSSGCWPALYSNLGAFASISTTVAEASLTYFSDVSFDPRKLLHYFHSTGISGNLIVEPIQLVSYRIVGKALVRDVYHVGQAPGTDRQSVIGDLEGAVMFSRPLGTSNLTLTQFAKAPSVSATFSKIKQVISGTMHDGAMPSASMNRNIAIYPKDCDMTFNSVPFCGDSDVAAYYVAHPAEKKLDPLKTKLQAVVGYWIEPTSPAGPKVPLPGNWFAIGYDDINVTGSTIGLIDANSSYRQSGSKLLKNEIDRVVSLTKFLAPSQSYQLYAAAMICDGYDDSTGTVDFAAHPILDNYTGSAQACSPVAAASPVPAPYGVDPLSVTCPSATPAPGCYASYSYSTSSAGVTTCSKTDVCPTPVATTGTPVTRPPSGTFAASGGGCFAEGTKITMADGSYKNIEDVKVGDVTLAFNEESQTTYSEEVIRTFHHEWKWENLYHMKLANGREIVVNDIHALYIVESGEYVKTRFIAPRILAGEKISLLDESGHPVAILSMNPERKFTHLYNLHMRGVQDADYRQSWGVGHNYFAEGVLVHNLMARTAKL